jgi:hypothetical protein
LNWNLIKTTSGSRTRRVFYISTVEFTVGGGKVENCHRRRRFVPTWANGRFVRSPRSHTSPVETRHSSLERRWHTDRRIKANSSKRRTRTGNKLRTPRSCSTSSSSRSNRRKLSTNNSSSTHTNRRSSSSSSTTPLPRHLARPTLTPRVQSPCPPTRLR